MSGRWKGGCADERRDAVRPQRSPRADRLECRRAQALAARKALQKPCQSPAWWWRLERALELWSLQYPGARPGPAADGVSCGLSRVATAGGVQGVGRDESVCSVCLCVCVCVWVCGSVYAYASMGCLSIRASVGVRRVRSTRNDEHSCNGKRVWGGGNEGRLVLSPLRPARRGDTNGWGGAGLGSAYFQSSLFADWT